ncbi:MAG: hypothetical protein GF308_05445 [Candidatus Heimdallarchaeota archaeon]|nr:hypothetical protein [Candidatus Heimdallarchaeota archaeon]
METQEQEKKPIKEQSPSFSPEDVTEASTRLRLSIRKSVHIRGWENLNFSAEYPSSWVNICPFSGYLQWLMLVGENYLPGQGVYSHLPGDGGYNHLDERLIIKRANQLVKVLNTRKRCRSRILAQGVFALKMLGRLDEVDREQLVERLQAKQAPSGGFYSEASEGYLSSSEGPSSPKIYADIEATQWSVGALAALDARPKDCLAVKEFVYSLQNTDEDYWFEPDRYRFYSHRQDASKRPSLHAGNTRRAVIPLRYLGFPIPFVDKLQQKCEEGYNWFMENYDRLSPEDKLGHFGRIAFWTYILPVRLQKIRKEIRKLAWEYLQELSDDLWKIFRNWATAEIFVPLGRANPRLTFRLSPGQLSFPLLPEEQPKAIPSSRPQDQQHSSPSQEQYQALSPLLHQSFILRIANETVLYYADVRPKQLRVADPAL